MPSAPSAPDRIRAGPVVLKVADRIVRFEPLDASVRLWIHGIRPLFEVDEQSEPDCTVACSLGLPHASDSVVINSSSAWEMRRLTTGTEEITFFAPGNGERLPWAQLVVDASRKRAHMIQRPHPDGPGIFQIGYPLDEFLLCRLLLDDASLVLHAAAVNVEGYGLVFLGHSGAGKSTIAGLARECGAEVLSDDRCVATLRGGVPTAWGTPWHGTLRAGAPSAVPISAIFLLVKNLHDSVNPIPPARAFAELLVRLVYPGAAPTDLERLLGSVTTLATYVPMAELRFRPTTTAFRLAYAYARELLAG